MEIDGINNEYYASYEDLEIHELMLLDLPRTQTYKKAIQSGASLFKDKVVMDVGSGTGILSIFCAQAGAKKVFAIEASNVAELSKKIITENKLESVISVFHGRVEEFVLPREYDKVDIIVSEWMGFYLLHEGMLDSVIFARDKFLRPGGLMFPDKAIIYASPCSVPSKFDEVFEGVNLKMLAKELRQQKCKKPQIECLKKENLLHEGTAISYIDLVDVTLEELNIFDTREVFVARKQGLFQGVCLWFEVMFPPVSDDAEVITLSTSPQDPDTHWKQTIIMIPDEAVEEIEEIGIPLAVHLNIRRNDESPRRYNILLEIVDAEQEEHALPCDCLLTKCLLTKQHLKSMENEM